MKRLCAAAASAALCAASVLPLAAPAAAASPVADGYYQPPGESEIIQVSGSGTPAAKHTALTYPEWVAAGRPAPRPLPVTFVRFPWGPEVFEVRPWSEGAEPVYLDDYSWSAAGRPTPQTTCTIPQAVASGYATSPELFLSIGDVTFHKLTYAQWRCAGSPAPDVSTNGGYVRVAGSATVYSSDDLRAQTATALTYEQWREVDFPTPRVVRSWKGARG